MHNSISKNKKLNFIQISRFAAILIILLYHINAIFNRDFGYDWLNISEWQRTGGVDFFFVLSGFMIFYIYGNNIGNKQKGFEFLSKRFIKIFPVYWLVLIGSVFLILFFPQIGDSNKLNVNLILKNLFLLPNDYILAVAWSITYIIVFYIVFSFLIFSPKLMKIIIPSWLLLCIISTFSGGTSYILNFYHIEFWVGVLIAYTILNKRVKYQIPLLLLGLSGFLFLWVNNVFELFSLNLALFYCLASSLIILSLAALDVQKTRKIPKFLSFLGSASFSLFITHSQFAQLYVVIFNKTFLISYLGYSTSMIIVSILSVLSSCVFYLIIEKPLTKFLAIKLRTKTPKKRYLKEAL